MPPTIGRTVVYMLKEADAEQINRRRQHARAHLEEHRTNANGVMVHVGNEVHAGDHFPMVITKLWGADATSLVNGTVFLDGSDTFWATSVGVGAVAGTWAWPERVA